MEENKSVDVGAGIGSSVPPVVPSGVPKPPIAPSSVPKPPISTTGALPKPPVVPSGVPKPPVVPTDVLPKPPVVPSVAEADKEPIEEQAESVKPPVAAVEGVVGEIPSVAVESEPESDSEVAESVNAFVDGDDSNTIEGVEEAIEPEESVPLGDGEESKSVPVEPPVAPPIIESMEGVEEGSALAVLMEREREVSYREQSVITREQQVTQMEQNIATYNQDLYEREMQLAQSTANLTAYQQSLEQYRVSLEAPYTQAMANLDYLMQVINESGIMVCVYGEDGNVLCYNPTEYAMMVNGTAQ